MSDVAAKPRRFPWAVYWTLFALIGVIAMLPFVTFFVSIVLANAYNCNINESTVSVCMIGGTDMGSWLQVGMFSFLYLFITWPLAFVLFLIWLIVLLVHRSRFKRSIAA